MKEIIKRVEYAEKAGETKRIDSAGTILEMSDDFREAFNKCAEDSHGYILWRSGDPKEDIYDGEYISKGEERSYGNSVVAIKKAINAMAVNTGKKECYLDMVKVWYIYELPEGVVTNLYTKTETSNTPLPNEHDKHYEIARKVFDVPYGIMDMIGYSLKDKPVISWNELKEEDELRVMGLIANAATGVENGIAKEDASDNIVALMLGVGRDANPKNGDVYRLVMS